MGGGFVCMLKRSVGSIAVSYANLIIGRTGSISSYPGMNFDYVSCQQDDEGLISLMCGCIYLCNLCVTLSQYKCLMVLILVFTRSELLNDFNFILIIN